MPSNRDDFNDLLNAYKDINAGKKSALCREEVVKIWKKAKVKHIKRADFSKYIRELIAKWQKEQRNKKEVHNTRFPKKKVVSSSKTNKVVEADLSKVKKIILVDSDNDGEEDDVDGDKEIDDGSKKAYPKKAQEALEDKIAYLKERLEQLPKSSSEIEKIKYALQDSEKKLRRYKQVAEAQKKFRDKIKGQLMQVRETFKLNPKTNVLDLRRLSRSPRVTDWESEIKSVPVKICRAPAEYHCQHIDGKFAAASIRYLENLASVLGSGQVFFLSQDDKSWIPIGTREANEPDADFLQVEYPDDKLLLKKQELIPSVYAGITFDCTEIGSRNCVGFSGPTFVAIRSGKHSVTTAATHAKDFETILSLDAFKNIAKTEDGNVKPILIVTSDGRPDENLRYAEVINNAIQYFRKHGLDALFIGSNPPGKSAYNRVEQRMVPLSRELNGKIIPHDKFGSHLNDEGETVDEELEKQNFEYAGQVLAEVWSDLVLDGYPVVAEYVPPEKDNHVTDYVDAHWYNQHVRESQYLLQIVKCQSLSCCEPLRSGLLRILPDRFLPPPVRVVLTPSDLRIAEKDGEGQFLDLITRRALELSENHDDFMQMPYDLFCPSVKDQLKNRTCKDCGLYHVSQKSALAHSDTHININLNASSTHVEHAYVEEEIMFVLDDINTSTELANAIEVSTVMEEIVETTTECIKKELLDPFEVIVPN